MSIAYLALGSNLGDRMAYMQKAIRHLKSPGIEVVKVSSIVETDPVGGPSQSKYLNAVIKIRTTFVPEELLIVINKIEKDMGRVRKIVNGPRIIDIDILLFDELKLVSRRLIIPHPRMLERTFVMNPLEQIQPGLCALLQR